jgi:hypothetical protein
MTNLRLGRERLDFDSQFHHCFWMGDLNYRVDLGLTASPPHSQPLNRDDQPRREEVAELIRRGAWGQLVAADQLHQAQRQGAALVGFKEADINFPPTFKVARKPGFQYMVSSIQVVSPLHCLRF